VWEVVRAVLSGIPRHSTIVELLDPLGWVQKPSSAGDGEGCEATVFNVSFGGLGKGVNVPNETGFKKLDRFFTVIQLLFVFCLLGGDLLVVAMGAGLGGDDEPVDDRMISVCGEVVAGDSGADRSRRHLSEGEEMVGGSGGSGGYWSMGSGSKESRYPGT